MLTQKFTPKYSVTYYAKSETSDKEKERLIERAREYNEKSYRNENISQATSRRLKKIAMTWLQCIELYNLPRRSFEQLRMTFITLTYPINMQDDKTGRKQLNNFIFSLQKKGFMKRYLWKAEAQQSGSLHYHLISDQFIKKDTIRTEWNKVIKSQIQQWDNEKEPFGTRIETIKDHNKAFIYILKYITKSSERRTIQGNKWGSSENLKQLEDAEETYYSRIIANNAKHDKKIEINEYCTVYPLSKNLLEMDYEEETKAEILKTLKNNYLTLFNEQIIL